MAPLEMVVPPVLLPRALFAVTARVQALIVVSPE